MCLGTRPWYDAWLRGASLRGLPADSDDSDSADETYNDFDDPRSRSQLVTRWLHQVLSTDFKRLATALTKVPYSIDDFEIDARLPADEQLKIFARYGWLDAVWHDHFSLVTEFFSDFFLPRPERERRSKAS